MDGLDYSLKVAGLRVLEARAQLGIAVGSLYRERATRHAVGNSMRSLLIG